MKILYITNMYPNSTNPYYGIFVKEQIDAIQEVQNVKHDVYVIKGRESKFNYIKSIFGIHKIISRGKYDLIHVHFGLSAFFLLFFKPRIPLILTLHGSDIQSGQQKYLQVITKWVLRRADKAIVVNNNMVDVTKRYISDIHVIPCGVNTQFFSPRNDIKTNNDTKYHIVFPSSRNRYIKNYPLFKATCIILKEKYNLDIECHYLENLSRNEVASLYQCSNLMLLTSISEGSPQVVKEAMASNLSVVTTNVGDVMHLLSGVANCYVAPKPEPELLAQLAYQSLTQKTQGLSPREKLLSLKLDDCSVAQDVIALYQTTIHSTH